MPGLFAGAVRLASDVEGVFGRKPRNSSILVVRASELRPDPVKVQVVAFHNQTIHACVIWACSLGAATTASAGEGEGPVPARIEPPPPHHRSKLLYHP